MDGTALVLRGLPGAGKTTTAALLRNALVPSVRVSNDSVRYMAQPRDFSGFTIKASELACMDLAISYLGSGFTPVIDGVFNDLDFMAEQRLRFRRKGLRLVTITLRATLGELLTRNSLRDPLTRMDDDRIRLLHDEFELIGIPLDIEDKLPEEVADCVLELLEEAAKDDEAPAPRTGTEVLFLRHGAPDYPPGLYPDPYAMGLSPDGRAEAVAARAAVERFAPDAVYTSDFQRAHETAALAAGSLGAPIQRTEALRERVIHAFAGKPLDQVRAELGPEASRVLGGNTDLCEYGDEETFEDARRRVLAFFDDLAGRHDGQKVLVVGHGGPHSWLVGKAMGADLKGLRRMRWDTGHFSRFHLHDDTVSVSFINRSPDDVA